MEVTRNGRFTAHEVTLDLPKPAAFSNAATDGKLWIFRVVVSYQYLWTDGRWHVLHAKVLGRRNASAKSGGLVTVKFHRPENWPGWLHAHVLSNTPENLAPPEMIK